MTIEIEPGRYFSHFWFVSCPTKDWLACLWREDQPDAKWRLQYRFRYYWDNGEFDLGDVKNHYAGNAPAVRPEESVVQAVDSIADIIRLEYRASGVKKVAIRSSDTAHVIEVVSRQPWMHLQRADRAFVG